MSRNVAAFTLHPRLVADTSPVCNLMLSSVLLMNDSRFPWLILVPRRADVTDIHELRECDRAALIEEVAETSRALSAVTQPDKINVAALGNLVPQLHVHVVARRRTDPAWPGPVWGAGAALPYAPADRGSILAALQAALAPGPRGLPDEMNAS